MPFQSFQFSTSDYTETDNCVATALAGGASCTVHVKFAPQAPGALKDIMVINFGASMNPLQIFLTGTGNFPVATAPSFSLAGGTYNVPQSLILTDSLPGATIHYTYYSPGIPPRSMTPPTTALSTSGRPASLAAAPYFSLAGGHYTTPQTLTLTDSTPGAAIYYTTNGTMPTTASTHYTSPITISTSQTVIAIAVASGYTNSNPASKAYTIP